MCGRQRLRCNGVYTQDAQGESSWLRHHVRGLSSESSHQSVPGGANRGRAPDEKTAGEKTTPAALSDPHAARKRERRGTLATISGLAVLHLRVADACVLSSTRECVALLDRNLVVRGALVCGRFLAGVSLLRRRVLLRIGRDTVDLGVGLSLDQRGVRFLHAD